jgi:Uncharacterized protein conserved in bacteria (DUF2188)
MARKKPVHVTPREDGWAVMREGNQRASSVHATQKEAEKAGRQAARKDKTEFVLHNRQGEIRQRDSYGARPGKGSGRPTSKYESPGEMVRAHVLLEDLTEEELEGSARFLSITPAAEGSSRKDASLDHDRYLAEV